MSEIYNVHLPMHLARNVFIILEFCFDNFFKLVMPFFTTLLLYNIFVVFKPIQILKQSRFA